MKMKKVLLVTKIGRNYGAVLQAYALKKALERLGAEVRILKYCLPTTENSYRLLPKVTGLRTFKVFLRQLLHYRETKEAVERFFEFREQWFDFTEPYCCYEDLERAKLRADVYITGSDQVWNPKISFDKAYYLLFAPEQAIKASYAASIGISSLPENVKEEFSHRVRNISHISVREADAQRQLAEFGISAQVHLDPTLLLSREDYDEIAVEPSISKPYVMLYLLAVPDNPQKIVEQLRRLYPGRIIVSIYGPKNLGDLQLRNTGPCEFIGLIRGADAVVTSSFHGTVFSMIYDKEFAVFVPKATGERICQLLSIANAQSHIVRTDQNLTRNMMKVQAPFSEQTEVKKMREDSLCYLHDILEEECHEG